MIQGRSGISLLIETTQAIAVLRQLFGQQFERYLASEFCVLSKIDFAHAARAELFQNSITGNGFQFHSRARLFLVLVYFEGINCAKVAASAPRTRTVLLFEFAPETISTAFCGNLKIFARVRTNSRFAAPATGGAAIRIRNAPSCSPTISLRDARGTMRTAKMRPRSCE